MKIKILKDHQLYKKDELYNVEKVDEEFVYIKVKKRVKYGIIEDFDGLHGWHKDSKLISICYREEKLKRILEEQ